METGCIPPVKNSLDLLRFVAASLVLYSHQHALLGLQEPTLLGLGSLGTVGVSIFFFLSGALVCMSWERDPDCRRFFIRRGLRIFPALWVVVILTALVLGPLVTTLDMGAYFAAADSWRYLGNGFLLISHVLPGVFLDNPYPSAVNGSLWTLPLEFLCYLCVAGLGALRTIPTWLRPKVLFALLCLVFPFFLNHFGSRFQPHMEMLIVFFAGASCSEFLGKNPNISLREKLKNGLFLIAMAALFLTGCRGNERFALLVFVAIVVTVAFRTSLGNSIIKRTGDLSYGMYIFAFPVQQTIIHFFKFYKLDFSQYLALSFVITICLSYISWAIIEKPALNLKSRWVSI